MRRRSRGTWLPTIGTSAGEGTTASGRQFFNLESSTGLNTLINPITFDEPPDLSGGSTSSETMADIIGSEYILRRIVGKLFAFKSVQLSEVSEGDDSQAILFGAGFFVARANDFSSGGGPDTPIGSASLQERNDNYSPLSADVIREPWIWRRTWVLGRAGSANTSSTVVFTSNATSPASTALYGSVQDGPHIDAKTARRVNQDERLWFVISCCNFPIDINSGSNTELSLVTGYLDFRLFGALRKARNRGVF